MDNKIAKLISEGKMKSIEITGDGKLIYAEGGDYVVYYEIPEKIQVAIEVAKEDWYD